MRNSKELGAVCCSDAVIDFRWLLAHLSCKSACRSKFRASPAIPACGKQLITCPSGRKHPWGPRSSKPLPTGQPHQRAGRAHTVRQCVSCRCAGVTISKAECMDKHASLQVSCQHRVYQSVSNDAFQSASRLPPQAKGAFFPASRSRSGPRSHNFAHPRSARGC